MDTIYLVCYSEEQPPARSVDRVLGFSEKQEIAQAKAEALAEECDIEVDAYCAKNGLSRDLFGEPNYFVLEISRII